MVVSLFLPPQPLARQQQPGAVLGHIEGPRLAVGQLDRLLAPIEPVVTSGDRKRSPKRGTFRLSGAKASYLTHNLRSRMR